MKIVVFALFIVLLAAQDSKISYLPEASIRGLSTSEIIESFSQQQG